MHSQQDFFYTFPLFDYNIRKKRDLYLSDLKLTLLLSTRKQIITWGNFSQKTPCWFLAETRLIVAHPLLHLDLAARQVVGCFDNRISYSLVDSFLFRPVPNIRLDLHVTDLSYLKTMNSSLKVHMYVTNRFKINRQEKSLWKTPLFTVQ